MKIGFDDTPAAPAGTYSQHLARLLAEYAPEHEYIIDGKRCKEFDLYHGFRPGLPFPVLLRRIPCVMTVHNLNFLRYPHLYSLGERLVLLRLYRRMLRSASRVITVNRDAREELSDRLRIDPGRIEVVMPLAARMPQNPPDGAELEGVRRKYALPRDFVLMLGTVEPRHNQEVLFEALALLREREREMLETRGAEMPTAAERTEVRAAERTGAQAGMQSGTEAGTETGAETGTEAGAETGMRTGARTGEQPAGGAAERTGERAAGRNVESVAEAGAFAETVARSVREPDGGGDLNPENAGWRDDTASDGVGGYGDVEAGAGLAMRGVGEDTPDANRNSPLLVGSVSARRTGPLGAAAPEPTEPTKPPESLESAKPVGPRTAVPTCRSKVFAAVPVHPSEMRAATSVCPLRMRGAVTPPLPQGGGAAPKPPADPRCRSASELWCAAAARRMPTSCWAMHVSGIWRRGWISSTNFRPKTCRRCSGWPGLSSTCPTPKSRLRSCPWSKR